jgi:hypothetical protein
MNAVASNIIFQRSLFKYVGDKSLKNNPLLPFVSTETQRHKIHIAMYCVMG